MRFSAFSATVQIIIITCIISVAAFIFPAMFYYLALTPSLAIGNSYFWTFFSHMFLHANFIHLFVNMFSLWFIGIVAERILGRKRFVSLYIIGGIIAGIIAALSAFYFGQGIGANIFGTPSTPMVGASGAIFAIAGVLAALIPYSRVYLLLGPLVAIILDITLGGFIHNQVLMSFIDFAISFYILFTLFSMFSFRSKFVKLALPVSMPLWVLPFVAILPLIILSIFLQMDIGNIAHLGGFFVGLAYGLYLRKKYKRKVALLQQTFR